MNGVHLASENTAIDIGRDDYFGHQLAGCVDVAQSTFLEPPSANAVEPPGWRMGLPGSVTSGGDGGVSGGSCRTNAECPPVAQCCPSGFCAPTCP